MSKQILFSDDVRAKIKTGVDTLANAVKVTVGPKGRNVVLDRPFGGPVITNDGVTIAKEIELEDKFENLGAQLVKQVAEKTNDNAGDGTTTATILAQAIITEGLRNVAAGANPMAIRRGIERATEIVVAELKKQARQITTPEETAHVASISANDSVIGKMIAEIYDAIGPDGVITIEESNTFTTDTEVVQGLQFRNGYISNHFVTDPATMEAILDKPVILVTDQKITTTSDILPLFEKMSETQRKSIVIIAEEVEGEALPNLIVNKMRGTIGVVCVKAPEFGERRKEALNDIAMVTGATVVSDEVGLSLSAAGLSVLGSARRVVVGKDKTLIVEGGGVADELLDRLEQLRTQLEKTANGYEKDKLRERIARLAGGVGVIRVGATTDVELREKKHRIEDAVEATKAALEEGIVAGGGVALVQAKLSLDGPQEAGDEQIGIDIVRKALDAPMRQIAENAGQDGSVVVRDVMNLKPTEGYDVTTNTYVDMLKAGIIDPVKVTRSALQNAASVSALLLTTEAAIVDLPNENISDDK
jgi:chaperonin GroEL